MILSNWEAGKEDKIIRVIRCRALTGVMALANKSLEDYDDDDGWWI